MSESDTVIPNLLVWFRVKMLDVKLEWFEFD